MTPLAILQLATRLTTTAQTKAGNAEQLAAVMVDVADRLSSLATAVEGKLIALSDEEIEIVTNAFDFAYDGQNCVAAYDLRDRFEALK